ncbi:PKD-like family lipoprotein [Flavihumibacter solisilvae]|uniref:PKD domain-containing protein n=1 Tax=Flavihumibacter solisilvae TaxID=1349421 RepID=A0A0C1L1R3_9BACT|nr:PKD-like family lipoprotein [Flavihumibacter solisilvae]KIC93521.1 hypothetical protein OI18_17360 [Flavihumibacter solisilvae]
MKQLRTLIYLAAGVLLSLLWVACYKDKGNYSYNMPGEPGITQMDSVYSVFVGDSLIIEPTIKMDGNPALSYEWRIAVPDPTMTDVVDSGSSMRVIFGLGAQRYTAKLTILNQSNGMKYFRDFIVEGKTAFSSGTTVLTQEGDQAQLSFIKPDGAVQARLFGAVNPGKPLPPGPTQLVAVPEARMPGTVKTYWVFGKDGSNTGIQVDANTFRMKQDLAALYFDAPETIRPSRMFASPMGVLTGVVNGRLQNGTTSTWDQAPTYGMFGLGAAGDYDLSPELVFNYLGVFGPGNYIGFDKLKKQFVRFNLYGDAIFFGTAYAVTGSAFDPMHVGADLEKMLQINGGLCYAYIREGGVLQELKFNTQFNGPFEFNPIHKRAFKQPELAKANSIWATTPNEIIYFTSGNSIYRYNPANEEFRELNTRIEGDEITMMKILPDNNTLVAGTQGSIYYLNISTGSFGDLLKKIDGLPGKVIDMAERNQ